MDNDVSGLLYEEVLSDPNWEHKHVLMLFDVGTLL